MNFLASWFQASQINLTGESVKRQNHQKAMPENFFMKLLLLRRAGARRIYGETILPPAGVCQEAAEKKLQLSTVFLR